MKKFIAFLLMLTMCVAMFAGCAGNGGETTPNTEASDPLAEVADYVRAMYIGDSEVLPADYQVVGSVLFGGVTYTVEWTADTTEENVKISVGTDGKVSIVTNQKSEVEVSYTLTATVKDPDGKTQTVEFKHKIPAVEVVDGGSKVVLYNPGDKVYATGTDYLYTSSSSGKQKHELVLTENKAEALPLTVQDNGDDTVSFVTADGKYLFCDGTDVKFVDEAGDYTLFVLEAAEGGYYIKCAVAEYSGKAQYIEVYSGYMTCYGMGSNTALYIFELQDAEGASGTVSSGDNTPDNSGDGENTGNSGNTGDTGNSGNTGNTGTGGNTGSTEIVKNGDQIVIYNPGDGKYATGIVYVYTKSSGSTKDELELTDNKSEALVLTVQVNSDKTVTFVTADGKYLFCDGTNVNLATSTGEYTSFVLESANGGCYIKCATASYNDKAQYLEIYKGYLTCFSMGTDTALYVFELQAA